MIPVSDIKLTTIIQRYYINWLSRDLSIQTIDEWYSITKESIDTRTLFHKFLLRYYYNANISKAIEWLYPEYTLYQWLFVHNPVSFGFWKDLRNVEQYVKWCESKIGIKEIGEWKYVSGRTINKLGGKIWLLFLSITH